MLKFIRPEPIDNEISIDPSRVIMSKTDSKGVIQYANQYFMDICGYKEWELMGKPHNVIRHPDMPKVIFKFMWERLRKGENIFAAVKNLAKDGSYYWVMTNFTTNYDEYGNIESHVAYRKAIPKESRKIIEDLYAKIIKMEADNINVGEKYFYGFIENSGKSYDNLFLDIIGMSKTEYLNYFTKKQFNTSTKKDTNVLDVDFNQIEKKESKAKPHQVQYDPDELIKLKEDIAKLKNELAARKKNEEVSNKSFFKRFFSK